MDTDEARGRSFLKIIAWPFFRHPGTGRYRCAAAGALALLATAVGLLHTDLFRLPTEPLSPDSHARLSLEHALAWTLCGQYGALGADFNKRPPDLLFDLAAADKRHSASLAEAYGSLDQYCAGLRQYLNNENGLFLLEAALLALPPDDSLVTLAAKLAMFRCLLLALSLSILAFLGVGFLPLALIAVVAVRVVGATQATHLLSVYPTMTVLLLFSSALIAVFSRALGAARISRLVLAAAGFGLALGFIYNWRTSYGPVVLGQLVLAVAVMAVARRGTPPGPARLGVAAAGIAAGFLLFQATFIWTLQRHIPPAYNYADHALWHPIVLGLANPPNALAEREGIQWYDPVGLTLARRIDPDATFLGPTYDSALGRYYFGLWRKHPWEMLEVYRSKLFEITQTMMASLGSIFGWPRLNSIATVIPNGYVWTGAVLVLGLLAMIGAWPFPALLAFSAALVAALLLITAEQAITLPIFTAAYQGNLIVNFAALLALVVALAFAWIVQLARRGEHRPGDQGNRNDGAHLKF
jgi:hypothetical protein